MDADSELHQRLRAALKTASGKLLAARNSAGVWTGELSSSALSTATAVTALSIVLRAAEGNPSFGGTFPDFEILERQVAAGLAWLAKNVNSDGGWGDTIRSISNLSTTTLCWAAFAAVPAAQTKYRSLLLNAERWLRQRAGGIEPDKLGPAIIERYGTDRTFSVPILTMCALSGRLGAGRAAWEWVIPLPFELAACPARWFAALRLPVVSYALPALIAIGQARHHHAPSRNPLIRHLRELARSRTLRILTTLQPDNGGFLEATPLTSFVVMSLAGSGQWQHPVTVRGATFLSRSMRMDGSWPIDTNLATWLTTLSINALLPAEAADDDQMAGENYLLPADRTKAQRWLLGQQYRVEHPYTRAAPGGWAWTDLPGGVPDADDTSGALRALQTLRQDDPEMLPAGTAGVIWLLDLQNRDGGIPTFCRGWGTLPFDRSSADITAHALRAWTAWWPELDERLQARTAIGIGKALEFLQRIQRADGAWAALWFGNQFAPDELNLTYGTARVVHALAEIQLVRQRPTGIEVAMAATLTAQGVLWLIKAQNRDGGWGGDIRIASSVEETALAVEALALAMKAKVNPALSMEQQHAALKRGLGWLIERVETGEWQRAEPIGFYFAKLWYFDKLYPLIFTVGALRTAATPGSAGVSPASA